MAKGIKRVAARVRRVVQRLIGSRRKAGSTKEARPKPGVQTGARAERAPGPVAPPKPRADDRPWHHVHLGLDFGTCWSKLVLRDCRAASDRCFVVPPRHGSRRASDYRVPSSVVWLGDRLYFGLEGARRAKDPSARSYHSLKMRAALPSGFFGPAEPLPPDFSAEDLATLVMCHLLQTGFDAATEYVGRFDHRPKMTMSVGAPMSFLDDGGLREVFLRMARVSYDLLQGTTTPSLAEGVGRDTARALLAAARGRVATKPTVVDPREWVRSEAEAALLWAFRSPDVSDGLYGCVDIGAGTADASFFRITSKHVNGTWTKEGLDFYSAVSGSPGVDAIDRVLLSKCPARTFESLRGHEDELIGGNALGGDTALADVMNEIFAVYQRAFQCGYRKECRQSTWEHYRLFVLGGGSRIRSLAARMRKRVWEQLRDKQIQDPGVPEDLRDWSGRKFDGDATFLLVAYGLSYPGADVPPVESPGNVPPWKPECTCRPPIDQDEYYPK